MFVFIARHCDTIISGILTPVTAVTLKHRYIQRRHMVSFKHTLTNIDLSTFLHHVFSIAMQI